MDAVEYIREAKRICKSRSVCKSVSDKCPLLDENGHCTATADIYTADVIEKAEKAVQIVEQWSKAHPIKTRQSEFLKQFPNAKLSIDGVLAIRPCKIDSKYCTDDDYLRKCGACAGDYWLTEVTDNGND